MTKLNYPKRIFSLSDCHGGQKLWHPFTSPDVAARLAEAIRSDLPGLQHIDTYGAPQEYYRYIVREAVRLQKENKTSGATGIFINSAPRIKKAQNGATFYKAVFSKRLVIVSTSLAVFSFVQKDIQSLHALPETTSLFNGKTEQHRSSWAVQLLTQANDHELELVPLEQIPQPKEDLVLSYVDRFGNMVLSGNSLKNKTSANTLVIGTEQHSITLGTNLADTTPGTLTLYSNDSQLEVLKKWEPHWTPEQSLELSAWASYNYPKIGTLCTL